MYVQTPTRSTIGWRPAPMGYYPSRRVVRRVRRGLGDDAAILQQVFAGQSGAPAAANVQQVVQTAMEQNSLYTTENCSGIVTGKSTASLVLTSGGGAAVSWASTAIAAGASGPLAPIVLAVGGVIQVFGAIFGHHAAKVQQEQQIICAVVQSINDSLAVIDQAFGQAFVNADQAGRSLDALYTALQQNVQPILKQDSGHCNAACFILAEARGVIAKRKAMYLDLEAKATAAAAQKSAADAAQQAAMPAIISNPVNAASNVVDQLAASSGLPAIVIWGIGGLAAARLLGVV